MYIYENVEFYPSPNTDMTSSLDIFKEQLSAAHGEYQALKVELGRLQKSWDSCLERHVAKVQKGQYDGVDDEMTVLEDREKHVKQMMDRWLTVIEECIKALC